MRFDSSPGLLLGYASLLIDLQRNAQGGNNQVQAAKKLEPNLCERFVIFVREQQHMEQMQAQGAANAGAVDLTGYVELNRNYKMALRAHRSALHAVRNFWRALMHADVAFSDLTKALAKIEAARLRADRTYKSVLERYPNNVKVLRAYARFLEDAKNDPWGASKYHSEADHMEEQEASGLASLGGGGAAAAALNAAAGQGAEDDDPAAVDERSSCLCIINAAGIIQMANKNLLKMFGYKKAELEGKNVSLLMPQPFSSRHNSYLRNYTTTGNAKILDNTRQVVALHKARYVFPVTIYVTKVSGNGGDAIFMGSVGYAQEDPTTVRAWVTTAGLTLCVDRRFTDWLGLPQAECEGRPLAALAANPAVIEGLLARASGATGDELADGKIFAENVGLCHKYAGTVPFDITIELGGTDDQRLFVAALRRRGGGDEYLMALDKRGHVTYATSGLASLLGSTPESMVRQELGRFMAQPFSQLHAKWIKEQGAPPARSCRAGAPVVLFTAAKAPLPAVVAVAARESGDEMSYVVKVTPMPMEAVLCLRRLSLRIDASGCVLGVADGSPVSLFGFDPAALMGRSVAEFIDVFEGLPERAPPGAGPQSPPDIERVIDAMVHKTLARKETSWRCGVRPPGSAAAAGGGGGGGGGGGNALQALLVANQTRAALMELAVEEADEEHGDGVTSITLHLWRSDMVSAVVELDRDAVITKAGCCALHQPGLIFGVPSSSMLRTPLSRWIGAPPTYDGLLLEERRHGKGTKGAGGKRGALKMSAADVKVGPLRHCAGCHVEGGPVQATVQAAVKEGVTGQVLSVKLTAEAPSKGDSGFARRMLGLPTDAPPGAAAAAAPPQPQRQGSFEGYAPDPGVIGGGAPRAPPPPPPPPPPPRRAGGGVKFAGSSDDDGGGGGGGGGGGERRGARFGSKAALERLVSRPEGGSDDGMPDDDGGGGGAAALRAAASPFAAAAEGAGGGGGGLLDEGASQVSGGDDASSLQEGSEAGGYQSDFKRGKRLRKLARLLLGKRAQTAAMRFRARAGLVVLGLLAVHTAFRARAGLVVLGLLAVHTAFFVATITLIQGQEQYVHEVDDASSAVIGLHRMLLDCRVLQELHAGVEREGLFMASDLQRWVDLTYDATSDAAIDATNVFWEQHKVTYFGRSPKSLRRFKNRVNYKLEDYWEDPFWNATMFYDTEPPSQETKAHPLWALGNDAAAAALDVAHNHAAMTAGGRPLSAVRQWQFVIANGPWSLYVGYRTTIYGLVERALAKVGEVSVAMTIFLALEGCLLFAAATLYIAHLMKRVTLQRYNLFSLFLVLPAGFLRALASKQAVLDEDDDSDDDSEDGGPPAGAPPQTELEKQTEAQSMQLALGKKGAAGAAAAGRLLKPRPPPLWLRIVRGLNPLVWLNGGELTLDLGKKRMLRDSRDTLYLAAPFVAWGAAVVAIYGVTITKLAQVAGPFRMLNMINFLVFRVLRGVVFSLELCLAPDDQKAQRASELKVREEDFIADYHSFLYGSSSLEGLGLSRSAENPLAVDTPALFQDEELARIFFREKGCMRADQAECFPKGHKYYDVTHSGLDAMVNRFIQEVDLLLHDPPEAISIDSPRLEYIWQVGRKDLFEGMSTANEAFRHQVSGVFGNLRTLHVIVFAGSLALAAWVAVGAVRPFMRRNAKETRQIAELLSQLPAEMDVEALVATAVAGGEGGEDGEGGAKAGGGGGAPQRGSASLAARSGAGGGGANFGGGGGGGGGGGYGAFAQRAGSHGSGGGAAGTPRGGGGAPRRAPAPGGGSFRGAGAGGGRGGARRGGGKGAD
ncbi:MAG: hypothetical protein J3K34DRAFT_517581 [Monoraphidium minutum]|nr:MAG: hypothetical protein J3K34DRAFT_517581 [Monoraphidium minutum]